MEQICKVVWNTDHSKTGLGNGGCITSSWSCNNLFAFTAEKKKNGFLKKYFHILNPNQPWEIHSGECKHGDVLCLEWDPAGARLLVVDSVGMCTVWAMNNYLTNSWAPKQELGIEIKGEEVIKATWFHNATKYTFYGDKFDSINVEEKLKRDTFKSTLSQQGGQAVDGYIAITNSGLVVVNVIQHDLTATKLFESLEVESCLMIADVGFNSDGKIIVMATDGVTANKVHFWSILLNYDENNGRLQMTIDIMPSLSLKSASVNYPTISHAKFVNRSQSNHVLLCVKGQTGSKFEGWLYKKVSPQIHKLFGAVPPTNDNFAWQFVTTSNDLPKVLSFTIPPLPVSTTSADCKAGREGHFYCGFGMLVALADNNVVILHRCTLIELLSKNVANHQNNNMIMEGRKRPAQLKQSTSVIKHVVFSQTSCALIALDNEGSLILYRVSPWLSNKGVAGTTKALKHLTHLLHYCLVTGFDWWDVLLHFNNPALPEQICSQLNNDFKGYSTAVQEMLHSRLQSMNITIFQSTWHPKATDCHVRLLMKTIAVVFRSILKASDSSSNEGEADEKLIELCSTSPETNIRKLIQVIDNPLPSMLPLIQWVVDIALYLLANIPYYSLQSQPIPGFSLIMDKEWLGTLREMLIIIKTWCLINSKCSPTFVCYDDELDPIAHVFALVTNAWAEASVTREPVMFSKELIDKCQLLSKLIMIPNLDIIMPNNGIIARLNDGLQNKNFVFEKKPSKLNSFKKTSHLRHISSPEETGAIDHLRRLYLGKSPVNKLKQCMRCGILTALINTGHIDSSIKMWDDRFSRTCLCGGRWMRTTGPIIYECDV